MIYGSDYKRYAKREHIKNCGFGFTTSLILAIVAAALSLAARYLLMAVDARTPDLIPPFLYSSFFGHLLVYVAISIVLLFLVLCITPELLNFFEITTNRWNLLSMMGISVAGLCSAKVVASVFTVFRYYTIGYILSLASGFICGYSFVINYLVALYFVGAVLILLFLMIATALSSLTSSKILMRLFVLISGAAIGGLVYYYGIFTVDSELLASVLTSMVLLKRYDSFLVIAVAVFTLSYFICLIVAVERSKKIHLEKFDVRELDSSRSMMAQNGN